MVQDKAHVGNHYFCATKNHPFLKTLLTKLNEKLLNHDYDLMFPHFVYKTTGPSMFTTELIHHFLVTKPQHLGRKAEQFSKWYPFFSINRFSPPMTEFWRSHLFFSF